ncbi:Rz-like lysis system protein LysB [Halomonas sp. MC140]|nr:Rz-like lysis system protein LysB [Halomonas sp. MC140]MDN7131780.1 Rz-like lysis system protein LysB [Halomonas sp. MC140]
MNRLLAALAILLLVLLITWALWQRTHAAEARVELAEQQLAESLTREAKHQVIINALWENAHHQANQRRALAQQQAELARTASNRQATIEDLHRENETLRAWASARLPDAVSRMRERSAITGAAAYYESVRDAQPLHTPSQ